ncbi:MAG: hypothetical protein EHM78_22810 [Myxococcaceae bacterium]|nr:MAG: hypothetical protein EHM78_22810 [Myxococcaceae bacterium]
MPSFPPHARTRIRMSVTALRYRRGGQTLYLAVGGGFVEVARDRVLVVTPRCERPPLGEPDPRSAAQETCRTWRRERVDSREAIAVIPNPRGPSAWRSPAAKGRVRRMKPFGAP